jgi:CheY-like chemotaxis protein
MADGWRVLVVDDEPVLLDVLAALLEDDGHAVRTARDGREALTIMMGWQPDLILLDLMMPLMDGGAFRAEQRRLGLAPDAPLIVLSAGRGARAQGDQLGAAAVITKPFELETVLAAINRVLQGP